MVVGAEGADLSGREQTAAQATRGRLEDQIAWYDRKSMYCQRTYKRLKIGQVTAAALVPLAAGLEISAGAHGLVAGLLGVAVVVIEALQHTNKYHELWITYRSTCEALKHEKFLHVAKAGPYRGTREPDRLLAERVETLVSREHTQWVGELRPTPDDPRRAE
jgi:hypothetical protein